MGIFSKDGGQNSYFKEEILSNAHACTTVLTELIIAVQCSDYIGSLLNNLGCAKPCRSISKK